MPPRVIQSANALVSENIGETCGGGKSGHHDAGPEQPSSGCGPCSVFGLPEDQVAYERCDEEGNGERDQHGVDRVPGNACGAFWVGHDDLHWILEYIIKRNQSAGVPSGSPGFGCETARRGQKPLTNTRMPDPERSRPHGLSVLMRTMHDPKLDGGETCYEDANNDVDSTRVARRKMQHPRRHENPNTQSEVQPFFPIHVSVNCCESENDNRDAGQGRIRILGSGFE